MATRELTFDVIGRGNARDLQKLARELDKLAREMDELDGKRANPTVDIDTRGATGELKLVDSELDAIDGRVARARVKIDVDKDSTSALGLLGRGGAGLTGGLVSGGIAAAGLAADLARVGAQAGVVAVAGAGITAAWGAAASAIAAAPPLLTAAAAAGGAVALGLDGIERSAKTIKPQFDALKKSVSATFERGLNPAMADLAKTFPTVERGSNKIAESLTRGAREAAAFVSQGEGLALVETIFNNTAAATDKALPGLGKIGKSLLEVGARAPALDSLAHSANRFGVALEQSVDRTITSGNLDKATSILGDTVGELGELFITATESGIDLYSRAGPGVNRFLNSVGGFLGRFDWERLGGSVGRVFSGLGETLDDVPPETISEIEGAFGRLGELFQDPDFQGDLQSIIAAVPEFIDGLRTALDIGADAAGFVADIVKEIGGENIVWGLAGAAAAGAIWKGLKGAAKLWKGVDLLTDLFGKNKGPLDIIDPKDLFKKGLKWTDILPDLVGTGIGLLGDLLGDLLFDPEVDIDEDAIKEAIRDAIVEGFEAAMGELDFSGLGGDEGIAIPISADATAFNAEVGALLTGAWPPIVIPIDGDDADLQDKLSQLQLATLGDGPYGRIVIPIDGDLQPLRDRLAEIEGLVVQVHIEWVIPPLELPVPPAIRVQIEWVIPPLVLPTPPAVRVPVEPDDSSLLEWLDDFNLLDLPGQGIEIPLIPDDGPLRDFLENLPFLGSIAPISVPISADASQFNTTLSSLTSMIPTAVNIPITADNTAALAAIQGVVDAGNAANTRATHTHDVTAALAAIASVVAAGNAANTTARHTQTHNVDAVLAAINGLNSANTTSRHTVSHNVAAVLNALDSLNGHNTSSTHTVTTVNRTVNVLASGGAVIGFARGGLVPGYAPGRDSVPAMLSPGEAVLVPELVRMLGARTIMQMNRWASGGRRGTTVGALGALGGDGAQMPTFGADRAIPGRSGGTRAGDDTARLIERKLDELINLLRTRDGVTINLPPSPTGDPAENAQAAKLALRTM